jgi:hypothetical protein
VALIRSRFNEDGRTRKSNHLLEITVRCILEPCSTVISPRRKIGSRFRSRQTATIVGRTIIFAQRLKAIQKKQHRPAEGEKMAQHQRSTQFGRSNLHVLQFFLRCMRSNYSRQEMARYEINNEAACFSSLASRLNPMSASS